MPFVGLNPIARNGLESVERPSNLEMMISICRSLSKGIPFVRIDMYEINGIVYFGEVTFFPASGLGHFSPEVYNNLMGELIPLPI